MPFMSLTHTPNDQRDPFSRAESLIEQLVEGGFARLFGQRLHPREVASRLAHAVEDNAALNSEGTLCAPNAYDVSLNPDDYGVLIETSPDLARQLAETVIELAHRAELVLTSFPKVAVLPESAVPPHDVWIAARHDTGGLRSTQALNAQSAPANPQPASPRNPQLILHGNTHVQVDRPVMNIGRRRTNHVVIDDPRVSRVHAQLRLRFGRYVLYDLGSMGGTFVNGQRVTECILRHGDVISLAGVALVYVEDESGVHNVPTDTQIRQQQYPSAEDADPLL